MSDSNLSATGVTHTIVFQAGADLTVGTVITVAFNANFTGINSTNLSCPSDAAEGGSGQDITCTVAATLASTTAHTITLTDTVNPSSAGPYDVTISHDETGAEESTKLIVYIIDDVTVTAHVESNLTFQIAPVASTTVINGDAMTKDSSTTTIEFGDLEALTAVRIGQEVRVTTNASGGFTVTVQQDGEMETAAGANINSFRESPDNTGSTTPEAWAEPTPILGLDHTYGHVGLTSSDGTLNWGGGDPFDVVGAGQRYAGLNGTAPMEVLYHDGPADGTTAGAGMARVGYQIEISALQEAGDYSNVLTYICTPTF